MTHDTSPDRLSAHAMHELLGFPARHLSSLPIPLRIDLQVAGIPYGITMNFGCDLAPEPDRVTFGPSEVAALVTGVEAERLWAADLRGMCLRKHQDPSWELTLASALGGAQPTPESALSLRELLDALDAMLLEAALQPELETAPPADAAHAA